jgi:hypothetical protein
MKLLRGLWGMINKHIRWANTWTFNKSPKFVLHKISPILCNNGWMSSGKHHSTLKIESRTNHNLSHYGGAWHWSRKILLRGFLGDNFNKHIWRANTWTMNISPPFVLHNTSPIHSSNDWKSRRKDHSKLKIERCTNPSHYDRASHYMGRDGDMYDTNNYTA